MTVAELQEHLKNFDPAAGVWIMLAGKNFLPIADVTAMGDEISTPGLLEDDCVLTASEIQTTPGLDNSVPVV